MWNFFWIDGVGLLRVISAAMCILFMFSSLTPLLISIQSDTAQGAAASPTKWIRYAGNPVLSQGAGGSWESACIASHSVINDSGTFKMWYGGSTKAYMEEKVGYATSPDGKSWTKHASNPVLGFGPSGSWDSSQLSLPMVIKDGATYKMWYAGYNGTYWRIGYATSADGVAWTKYAQNPVMDVGVANSWDSKMVMPDTVRYEDGEYRMWYQGNDGSRWRFGYANSTDGINWTRYASNPIIQPGAGANDWDKSEVGQFSVVNASGTYQGWYAGNNGVNWCIGYATSPDGMSWTKHASNPVLTKTGNGFENHDVMSPRVIYDGSCYRLWYAGIDSGPNPWVFKFGYAEGWNTVPDAPALTAPATNVWTSNNRPTFTWTFSDPNAGDAQTAYEVQLDDDGAFGSVNHGSGKISSAAGSYTPAAGIADGIYYWRARTWDSDDDNGAWSASRILKIDTVPPVNPGSFSSSSHVTGVWSNNSIINIAFSGASDAGSGLDGYSLAWDYSCNTIPDPVKDIEETVSASTSQAMSDSASVFFHIRAIDNVGLVAADASHYGPFYIDSTPPLNPVVSSSTHSPGMWSNITVCNVSWVGGNASISGPSGYSAVWDKNAGTVPPPLKNLGADAANSTSPDLSDGTWYFHIRAQDNATTWAPAARHFGPIQVDAAAPFNPLAITADRPTSEWSNDRTIDVQWSGAEGAVSGLDGYSFLWDSSTGTIPDETKDCEETTTNATGPALADGKDWYFHLRTRDNAGNWNASALHLGPFWIDGTAPANPISVTSVSHAVRSWSNDTTIDIAWSVADGGGGISGYDGFSIVWDISATTIPDTTMDYDANRSSATSPPMPDGDSLFFHIRARDRAGNWAADAAHLGPFWIDSSPPKNPTAVRSTSHSIQNWSARRAVDINWSGADGSISGIDGYSYLWDTEPFTMPPETVNASGDARGCTSPVLGDGTQWYFHIRVNDAAGNWAPGASHSGPYFIDGTPPAIHKFTINGGAAFCNDRTVTLQIAASDPEPGSGLGALRWRLGAGNWSEWRGYVESLNISVAGADGPRTVAIEVRDNAGNAGADDNSTIFLDTSSPGGPGVTVNGGALFTNNPRVSLEFAASDAEPSSGIADMSLSLDMTHWDGWEPYSSTLDYNLSGPDGNRTVYLRVRDRAGNIGGPVGDDIFLDTVLPAMPAIVISGGSPATTNLSVGVRVSAADAQPAGSGIGYMSFSEDGANWTGWEPFCETGIWTFSPGEGIRVLYARVRDRALNEAGPANDTVLVDTTAPIIMSVQLSGISRTIAVVSWSTNEPSSGTVEYAATSAYGSALNDPVVSPSHSLTITGLAPDTAYHLRVGAKDALGNGPSWAGDMTFRTMKAEDRRAPVVSNVQVEAVTDRGAIISWQTDEPADSVLEYGTTRKPDQRASDMNFTSFHIILLAGLEQGRVYYFIAKSVDPSGNGPGTSGLLKFTTPSNADRTPPVISGIRISGVSEQLAVISWETDEPASGILELRTGPIYTRALSSDGYDTQHSFVVAGLVATTIYHFRVGGTDCWGNGPSFSGEEEFTTTSMRDKTAPSIISVRVVAVGRDAATIEVILDEPGTVLVAYGKTVDYAMTAAGKGLGTTQLLSVWGLEPQTSYHYRAYATDAGGNGPTAGTDQMFTTRPAPVSTGFGLTTEEMPVVLIIIVVLAVGLTVGLWAAGRRRTGGTGPKPPFEPTKPAAGSSAKPPVEPRANPPASSPGNVAAPLHRAHQPLPSIPPPPEEDADDGAGPIKTMLKDKVHSGELEDGEGMEK